MARAAGLEPVTGKCVVRCLWFEKDKRRDPDNIRVGIKYILDGLVEAGVLPTDGWKYITGLEDRFYVDKERPRVEIEIIEEP
jgi:Holliday junction resolvase RusA-like endonuclease